MLLFALGWAGICLGSMLAATGGALSMPLDDAFIFFQYARRVVELAPFTYQEGGGISSGATSLLTVAVHSVGYLVGFRGEAMAVFALVLGAGCFAWAGVSAHTLGRRLTPRVPWLPPALVLTSGPLVWGFYSGMDLPLFVALALAFAAAWPADTPPPRRLFVLGALLGLARPDAVFLILPAIALGVWRWGFRPGWLFPLAGTLLPFALQTLLTGRPQSASMEVKSVLSHPGFALDTWIAGAASYLQMVLKGVFGGGIVNAAEGIAANNGSAMGHYLVPFALWFLMLGAVPGAWVEARSRRPGPFLLLVSWTALLLLAQAFTVPRGWHWHRYLMPLYAFTLPLLAVGVDRCGRWVESVWEELRPGDGARGLGVFLVLLALPGAAHFAVAYGRNCADIRHQHIDLARRLNAGDPVAPRLLGIHDAGALAYFGDFPTLDLEGLTSARFRDAARLGGAGVWEAVERLAPPERPDVLALYASWFGNEFVRLHRPLGGQRLFRPSISAGNPLGLYAAEWGLCGSGDLPRDPDLTAELAGWRLRGTLDVADLESEGAHRYRYRILDGAYQTLLRILPDPAGMPVVDGGRLISGSESFRLGGLTPGADLLLVARTHAPFRIRVETTGGQVGTWTEGGEAEGWRETRFVIPGSRIDDETLEVRLASDDPHHSAYGAFHYWFYQR